MVTKSKICFSRYQHLPMPSCFPSLSETLAPWMMLLRSCMRFLTSLSRHPECYDAAAPVPSETALCTPQMPWFQFGQHRPPAGPVQGTAKGTAVSQQSRRGTWIERVHHLPAAGRAVPPPSIQLWLVLPAHPNHLWFSAISHPCWEKDFCHQKPSSMSQEVIWSPTINREECVCLATWPNIKSVFSEFFLSSFFYEVARSAPQTSKTTWAVCCSSGNALEGGLGSFSELRTQIRLLLSCSPWNPALQTEVRGRNCVLCVIGLEFLRALSCQSWTAECSRLQRWRHELCLLFMGFLLTLPNKITHSLSIFFFFFLLTFFGCSFTDISLSFPHIPTLPLEMDCKKKNIPKGWKQPWICHILTNFGGGWSPFP